FQFEQTVYFELRFFYHETTFVFRFLVVFFFGFMASRSTLIRSRRTEAGSSVGSCGTSSPRKALARID
ncbi:MAG TPA: hypothetical protein VJ879_00625, partial [Desulfobacter sp.]|nr:hypothetical protein [Desulfobacter sp.]